VFLVSGVTAKVSCPQKSVPLIPKVSIKDCSYHSSQLTSSHIITTDLFHLK